MHVFEEHDKLISGVDWCHSTDRIVTCSHDCNAYILAFKDGKWLPDMVRYALGRPEEDAATCLQDPEMPYCHECHWLSNHT